MRKVLCVIVDNACANNTAIDLLMRNTTVIEDLIQDNKFMHVRCATLIIDLIMQRD